MLVFRKGILKCFGFINIVEVCVCVLIHSNCAKVVMAQTLLLLLLVVVLAFSPLGSHAD